MEIKPFIGFDDIVLGMTRIEIKTLLGDPDSTELENFTDKTQSDTWKYFTSELELTFSSEDDFRLTTITTYSKKAILDGITPIGLIEQELKKVFPLVILDYDFEEIGKDYVYPDYEISFWLSDNVVENLTLFPKYEQDQETIIWPKRS